jgi:hypothetical protein
MNELQRQHYLSALGIDTYMPRWQLPFAPISVACKLPASVREQVAEVSEVKTNILHVPSNLSTTKTKEKGDSPVQANNVLNDIFESKKAAAPKSQPASAAHIMAQLDSKPVNIDAFSLSVWRPVDELMIVDSRNSKLALPTELLINNLLQSFFSKQSLPMREEVLRWPMIENSFTKRTANDAREELQTWLSVQQEIRPIKYLWLMGSNASTYFLPEQTSFSSLIFKPSKLVASTINALVLPSLNEILQRPILKQKVFAAVRHYHFSAI